MLEFEPLLLDVCLSFIMLVISLPNSLGFPELVILPELLEETLLTKFSLTGTLFCSLTKLIDVSLLILDINVNIVFINILNSNK